MPDVLERLALLILVCLALPATPASAAGRRINFHGNTVLTDEVYLAVIDLPPDAELNPLVARQIEEKLLGFLYKAGYELAQVQVALLDGQLYITIDEGHLEKVILRGQGSLKTVQARLALNLPANVYNRPYIERQLQRVRDEWGIDAGGYELVPTTKVEHFGFQVDDLGTVVGYPIIPPRSQYELHIQLQRRPWGSGIGVNAGFSGIDGLRLGADYKNEGLLLPLDRYQILAQVGTKIRSRIDGTGSYVSPARVTTEMWWLAPPISGETLRPTVLLRAEMLSRQRPDLHVETYTHTRMQGALLLSYELGPKARFSLGAGGEQRHVFNVEGVPGSEVIPPFAEPLASTEDTSAAKLLEAETQAKAEPLILANVDLVFTPEEIRRDRRHELSLFARHYPGSSGFGTSGYRYQKVFELGWHDLWITSKGAWLWGDVPFVEEEPVGGAYLRGVFGDEYYVKNVAKVGVEFRWSLTRDLYKLSAFSDVAVFGELDLPDPRETVSTSDLRDSGTLRVASSTGVGFHALIADGFQLDFYYAFGLAPSHQLDTGLAIGFKQAF